MTKPTKILFLVRDLDFGGLQMVVAHLVMGLNRQQFQPIVVCYDELGPIAERIRAAGIEVRLIPRQPGIDIGYIFRLTRFARQNGIRIFHLHNPTALFYGTLAAKVARISSVIYTDHGRDQAPKKWRELKLNQLLSALVQRFVAVSAARRDDLVEREGLSRSRIEVIYNGIEEAADAALVDGTTKQGENEIVSGRPLIGIVARLDPIKDHASLFHALKQVVTDVPSASLLVIGDGPERSALQDLASTLGLNEHIQFLGFRDDVSLLLKSLDVFVLCSLSEGLSMTLVEACAAACPIVATDVGGNPEVIHDRQNGLLVPAQDSDALAHAIIELLQDREAATLLGQRARQTFEERFTCEAMVENYSEIYNESLQIE